VLGKFVGRTPTLGCAESQRRILPLPEEEGRGEGESEARCANSVGTSEVC